MMKASIPYCTKAKNKGNIPPVSKHILVIRLSAMGDVAMVVPVLWQAIQAHPQLCFTVLTRSIFVPLFADIPRVKTFAPDLYGKHCGVPGLWRLATTLKKLNIDAIADLHDVCRSHVLCFFLRIKGLKTQRIDKGRKEKHALTRSENKRFLPLKTTHSRYADVFYKLGFPVDLKKFEGVVRKASPKSFEALGGDHTTRNIGIAPFAAHTGKIYPLEKMKKVIQKLIMTSNYHVWLFGGKEQRSELIKLQNEYPNTFCLAGHGNFEEEISLISNLDLMVSMDSGNGHIAAMFGVPTVILWGVTHPFAGFAPIVNTTALLADTDLYPKIPTSVYGNNCPRGYERAIATISPDEVIKTIEDKLSF